MHTQIMLGNKQKQQRALWEFSKGVIFLDPFVVWCWLFVNYIVVGTVSIWEEKAFLDLY